MKKSAFLFAGALLAASQTIVQAQTLQPKPRQCPRIETVTTEIRAMLNKNVESRVLARYVARACACNPRAIAMILEAAVASSNDSQKAATIQAVAEALAMLKSSNPAAAAGIQAYLDKHQNTDNSALNAIVREVINHASAEGSRSASGPRAGSSGGSDVVISNFGVNPGSQVSPH
ncbi:hypothetical protein CCR94_08410 [Rhodoblastus sphagnicola]|uniref:HEAT repeat domain-containing protein n=1 Tax=Rhodoblastus sphagnicola TaxID=333368 RepID=A0A2S6NAR4_9HYPH|nr:hypothetical protein [Rhodoblastus sphagnicola]MBB4200301.1 hypothetical protein [Rhodoblastus sphagnicola]PPQ31684.1 hypothetical protein CCR94_08410 [Rhodoblastus sphagnicola]